MKSLTIALPVVSLFASTLLASPINLNNPVTLNGSFAPYNGIYGNLCGSALTPPPQGSAASLDDGVFLPEGTCYQSGPVYWNNLANTIDIDLLGTFTLTGAIVQADDNDTYELQYRDIGGTYHNWYDVPLLGSFGMITRPGSPDQTVIHSLPAVQATGLRFFALTGDGEYAASEIQVFAVPEPATTWLVLGGLAALFAAARRHRRV